MLTPYPDIVVATLAVAMPRRGRHASQLDML